MADTTPKIEDVHQVLKLAIADLVLAGIDVPPSLVLAAVLAQRHAVNDRRQP